MPITALFLAVSLAAPALATTPERLDALKFDNGAMLRVDGGSYNQGGVGSWTSWRLTDGDEHAGWCSPEGKPLGLAFEWELDSTWSLDTFAISTRFLQEAEYPGISARSVELHVSQGKGYSRVGTFQVGREDRKEFQLPKGTTARLVKVVVVANHGNAEFTEIAELDLMGTRSSPPQRPTFAGDFSTNYGPIRLAQDGDEVYGCYDWTDGARLWGTVSGRTVRVNWVEYPDGKVREGTATLAVTEDGRKLWGVWYEAGALQGEWAGERVSAALGPKCRPVKQGQLEVLQKRGRLVLYGIRFASDSDLPLPESSATIDQLAAMLKKEASLRVQIEGFTDSTNTATHNLDLSQRRAKAVVDALVSRGIEAARLQPKGFGPGKPVADNTTAQGRALNRRVEVSVVK